MDVALEDLRVVRDEDVAPGCERWADEDGAPVVRLSAAGTTPRLLTHLRQVWDDMTDPRWLERLGASPRIGYAVAPTVPAGDVVRVTVGHGFIVGTVSAHDMHPATAEALGPVLEDLWVATRVAAA